jgi:DNA helicase-2/ATP-dependent DNA helicase PcrA
MNTLNAEQTAVVNSPAKQLLVLAGAGSGKSRVLCERILRLISEGVPPSKIICISYTNSASKVLQERIGDVKLGNNSTLHGFLLRLLGRHHELVNLPERLSVIDDEQREPMCESIMADMGVKSSLKKVMPFVNDSPLLMTNTSKEGLVAREYHRRLRQAGLLDFQTILFYGLDLLKRMDSNAFGYTHVMWDEGQDGSDIDFAILEAMPCENKMLVGDNDQQIFSFRNADGKPSSKFTELALDATQG